MLGVDLYNVRFSQFQGLKWTLNPLFLAVQEKANSGREQEQVETTKTKVVSEKSMVLHLISTQKHFMFLGIASLVVSSATNLAFPTVIGKVVDLSSVSRSSRGASTVTQFLVGAIGTFCVGAIASFTRVYSFGQARIGIANYIRVTMFSQIISAYDCNTTEDKTEDKQIGSLVSCLSQDVDVLSKAICKTLASGLRSCSSTFGGTAMLLSISPRLTLVSIALLPFIGVTAMMAGKEVKRLTKISQNEFQSVAAFAEERFRMIKTVRLFSNEEYEVNCFHQKVENSVGNQSLAAYAEGVLMGGLSFAINTSLLVVLYMGGRMVANGQLTGGQLTSFGIYSGMVGLGSSGLSSVYADALKMLGASERILGYIQDNLKQEHSMDKSTNVCNFNGAIEFQNVHFQYHPNTPVLNGVNLRIENGSVTAITGQSGAGKSTIVSLLTKFQTIDQGTICIDNVDISTISTKCIRNAVGVVSQRPNLFHASIYENIRYGNLKATPQDVEVAAKKAHAHEFIDNLPKKYDTIVSQDTLSVGQLQRLAIARIILMDPPIVVMDEATSSLDGESEAIVTNALQSLMENKTVLIIAHRMTTLLSSNFVYVLKNGTIVESGAPTALNDNPQSQFYQLVQGKTSSLGAGQKEEDEEALTLPIV